MTATYQWQLLRAGSFRLDGGGMFGLIPKVIWSKMTEVDERNRIPLQTNCLLLEPAAGGGRRILIETGFGGKWDAKNRDIFDLQDRTVLDALGEVGVRPEMIDLVIVTHLHFDHAGGLTRLDENQRPVPTFPNARIIVQKTEWEDAIANKSTMTRTYLRENLEPIADQVELVEGEAEVPGAPGVHVWPMLGHTWGHQAVRFEDEHGIVCFPGDVMPTINHAGLAFSLGYDMLPYDNMLSKKRLLERAHTENWRLVLDHEPGNPVVRVRKHSEKPGQHVLQTA